MVQGFACAVEHEVPCTGNFFERDPAPKKRGPENEEPHLDPGSATRNSVLPAAVHLGFGASGEA